ncbi:MAG: sulfotransferase family protein [Gaiellaceae bacterium]
MRRRADDPELGKSVVIAHEPGTLLAGARQAVSVLALYGASARRVIPRGGYSPRRLLARASDELVFVIGSPRSGTTFLAESIASCPGFVDLGETLPLKAALPRLYRQPASDVSRRVHRILERVRRLTLVRGLRGVEQTPEVAFVLPAILLAYPRARVVHVIRDGRDVVCSLLERGWLSAGRGGRDDARVPYGSRRRFWVEDERAREFERASDSTRAAWAWRAYVTAAASLESPALLSVLYEDVALDSPSAAERIAAHLGIAPGPLLTALGAAQARSLGRVGRELTDQQLREVEAEAGPLLRELGYA